MPLGTCFMFLRDCFRNVQLLNCTNNSRPHRSVLGRGSGAGVSGKWHLQCHLNSDFPWSSRAQEEMVFVPLWESTGQDWGCSWVSFLLSALFQGCPGALWLMAG